MKSTEPKAEKRKGGVVRAYTLRLYPNPGKAKEAFGILLEQRTWLYEFVRQHMTTGEETWTTSTKGLGWTANRALRRAHAIVKAGRNSSIATGAWFNEPRYLPLIGDGTVEKSDTSTFDYWVKMTPGPRMPAKTHRGLKNALKRGGTLLKTCEIHQATQGWFYASVFVEFGKVEAEESTEYLGCDVGVNAGVARSDGYIGKSLRPLLNRTREKRAEQQRQGHCKSSLRSACKQTLDREARRAINVCLRGGKTLAVESLKITGNLQPSGSIGAWARQHFAKRCLDLAEVTGVAVIQVFPAYTSQTCPRYDFCHAENRRGIHFECRRCGYVAHADVVGARNVARKAAGRFSRWESEKAGIEIQDSLSKHPLGGVSRGLPYD